MRIHGLLVGLALVAAGCPRPDTAVRLMVRLGKAPSPQQLRVTIYGSRGRLAPPTMIQHPALPGTITMHDLSSSLTELCVALEGLAGDGSVTSRGAVEIGVLPGMISNAAIDLGNTTMLACPTGGSDGGGDLGNDANDGGVVDLAGADLSGAVVAVCPAGNLFCDDFETGDISRWDDHVTDFDMGSQSDVQQATVRHGKYALHVVSASPDPANHVAGRTIVIKGLPSVTPPIALRANVFAVQPIDHFGVTVELYDDTVHGFAVEADNQNVWTIVEDQATFASSDHHSDMVPFDTGRWHCVELVLDDSGFVTFYVDNHQLLPTFLRNSAVAYKILQVGIGRTINATNDVYIDDVAVGRSRLYCP